MIRFDVLPESDQKQSRHLPGRLLHGRVESGLQAGREGVGGP